MSDVFNYRFVERTEDAYSDKVNVIHFKFGDMRKMYNFTKDFRQKYPNFCAEFDKYWYGTSKVFTDPLQIVNYIEIHELPVLLYSNFYDEYFADYAAAKEWLCNERVITTKLDEVK